MFGTSCVQDPFEARYIELGRGAIEFRRPNLRELAKGTPLEGNDEVLTMGDNLVVSHRNKRPRQLANMFRTLILHIMGGIWVDTVRCQCLRPSASRGPVQGHIRLMCTGVPFGVHPPALKASWVGAVC